MKKLLLFVLLGALVSCEKETVESPKTPLIKCGTMHINSDGGAFRYQLGTSLQVPYSYLTQDTTFDIYENQLYRIYYKGTTIVSIDSVFFNPGGNTGPKLFDRIDTTYEYHIIEDQTGTGSQSFDHILPSTIYDR